MELPFETQSCNSFILPTFPLYQIFKKTIVGLGESVYFNVNAFEAKEK